MEVSGQLCAVTTLPPGKEPPSIHWIGGWVGPRASLDAMTKRQNPTIVTAGNWMPVIQPTASSLYWLSYPISHISRVHSLNTL